LSFKAPWRAGGEAKVGATGAKTTGADCVFVDATLVFDEFPEVVFGLAGGVVFAAAVSVFELGASVFALFEVFAVLLVLSDAGLSEEGVFEPM
jgi:hypothetical protein